MTEEVGTIGISFSDNARLNQRRLYEVETTRCSLGAKAVTDYGKIGTKTPSNPVKVDEGGYIVWEFKSVAADTVESEESDIMMSIFLINKKTGKRIKITLGTQHFTGFQSSATTDVVLTAAQWQELGKYQIPTGYMAMLAPDLFHCYIGDDT